jgi:hypothetical protein
MRVNMSSRPFQSQSIVNSPNSGQISQSLGNTVQSQTGNQSNQNTSQLSLKEVVDVLLQVETMIRSSQLPDNDKITASAYVTVAKTEIQLTDADKNDAAKNLKRASETIKSASETVQNTKQLWTSLQPLFLKIGRWLGVAKDFFGF